VNGTSTDQELAPEVVTALTAASKEPDRGRAGVRAESSSEVSVGATDAVEV